MIFGYARVHQNILFWELDSKLSTWTEENRPRLQIEGINQRFLLRAQLRNISPYLRTFPLAEAARQISALAILKAASTLAI